MSCSIARADRNDVAVELKSYAEGFSSNVRHPLRRMGPFRTVRRLEGCANLAQAIRPVVRLDLSADILPPSELLAVFDEIAHWREHGTQGETGRGEMGSAGYHEMRTMLAEEPRDRCCFGRNASA